MEVRVDCVTCRSGDGADDGALCTDQFVQQAGFARIGLPDDGDLDRFILGLILLRRKRLDHHIQKVTRARPMQCGDRVRLAQSQLIELAHVLTARFAFALIDHQEDRRPEVPVRELLLIPAQDIGHFAVRGSHTSLAISQEQDRIRVFDGDQRLLLYLLDKIGGTHRERGFAPMGRIDATGVDHVKFDPVPIGIRKQTVACGAGCTVHYRQTLTH